MPIPTTFVRRAAALSAAAGLLLTAGCGGGGGGGASTLPHAGGTSAPTTAPQSSGTAAMSITVNPALASASAKKRHLKFVSPGTESVTYQVSTLVSGVAQTGQIVEQDISATAAGCTTVGSSITCVTSIPAPVGTDTILVKTYNAFGAPAGATLLGEATSVVNVLANTVNTAPPIVVAGIPANIELFLAQPTFATTTAGQSLVVLEALDSSGNVIIEQGNYDQPITLSFGAANAHVSFYQNGASSSTATVTGPGSLVYVKYDGAGTAGSVNVIANATESPNGSPVNLTASTVFTIGGSPALISTGGSGAQIAGFVFNAIGQTGTITYSGPGALTATIAPQSAGVASATVSGSVVTVTSQQYGATSVAVTQNGATITYPISVVAAPITATYACSNGVTQCTSGGIIFPAITSGSSLTGTVTPTGGVAPYTIVFASGASLTSGGVASVTLAGGALTVTPLTAGTDVLEISGGNQTYYLPITVSGGAFNQQITSIAHAYYDSSTLTMDDSGGQALLTVQNSGTITPSGSCISDGVVSLTQNATQSSSYTIAALGKAENCTLTLTPAGGSPFAISVVAVTPMTLTGGSQFTLIAEGEQASQTFNGGSGSYHVVVQNTNVVNDGGLTFFSGSSYQLALTAGTTPGSSAVTITDQKLGDTLTFSVERTNGFASTLAPVGFNSTGNASELAAQQISNDNNTVASIGCATQGGCAPFAFGMTPTGTGFQVSYVSPGQSGTGLLQFTMAGGNGGYANVPFTVMAFTYNTVSAAVSGAAADESFGATGVSDTVDVAGLSSESNFSVASQNTGVVTAAVSGTGTIALSSVAAGQTTVTVTDTVTGASAFFSVTVTTTTIPVDGHGRKVH